MDSNQKIISRYINELNNRNFDVLNEVVANEVIIDSKKVTKEEYKQIIMNRLEEFPDYHVTILSMETKNDKVILNWHRTGTSIKTGRKLDEDLTSEYIIANGRISEVS